MTIVGELIGPLDIGPIAHGGHFVAHHPDGRVVFVRHTLPGERVMARLTQVTARIMRADAVEILVSAPERVPAPCSIARPEGCGGCDFQHIDLDYQRQLKARVLADQLRRLAGITWEGVVEPLSEDETGLGWRTRMRYLIRGERLGMRAHRSHRFVPLPSDGCLIAAPALRRPERETGRTVRVRAGSPHRGGPQIPRGDKELIVGVGPDGTALARSGEMDVVVSGRTYRLTGESFWQIHPMAARVLADAVLEGLAASEGESALDLYCGAGLFAGVLSERGAEVTGIDGNAAAIELARANVPRATFLIGPVEKKLSTVPPTDLVVLDPSRSGAGRAVMDQVLARAPRAIAYVACDPASLARDLAELPPPYTVSSVKAFDLFPMTQHFETVAIVSRRSA